MAKSEEIYWRAECSFAESHKHGLLAEAIGVSWAESVGIVAALYGQVRRQLPDGDVSRIPDAVLRRWCHSRKVSIAALKESGWVDEDGHIHGWDERYSDLAVKRAEARDRQRVKRDKDRAACHADVTHDRHAVVTQTSREKSDCHSDVTPLHALTREGEGEGEGEEDELPPVSPPPASGGSGAGAPVAFSSDVERLWEVYRAATGRKPAPLTTKAAARLAELIGWAGSLQVAEVGVRKVGASAFHRGENADGRRWDGLGDKPFRTADAFRGWCETPLEVPPGARATPRATPLDAMIESTMARRGQL